MILLICCCGSGSETGSGRGSGTDSGSDSGTGSGCSGFGCFDCSFYKPPEGPCNVDALLNLGAHPDICFAYLKHGPGMFIRLERA